MVCSLHYTPKTTDKSLPYILILHIMKPERVICGSDNPLLMIQGSYMALGKSWDANNNTVFMKTARLDKNGVISLGFELKSLIDVFSSSIKPFRGGLYLATKDGKVLSDGIPETRVAFEGNTTISFQLLKANGDPSSTLRINYDTPQAYIFGISGTNYILYSSSLDIIGMQSVYLLALPYDGLQRRMRTNIAFLFVLLLAMYVTVVVFILILIVLMARAARKEMCLRAALIKQKEATQQAERKNMNRSLAFVRASHDIRGPLAGITGLVEMLIKEVHERSELAENLRHVLKNSKDLYGILDSILDTSKIEAGKMHLEEKQFDLLQVLEDIVDFAYLSRENKKVDIILDLQDGSLNKFSEVEGDEGRLKQILKNLLNNAIKFTEEGYISIRARAKKPELQNTTYASTQDQRTSCLSCFFSKDDEKCIEIDDKVHLESNWMEFVFEVNDTGKGIPKENRESVFENYVQIKEVTPHGEGTGLGLGIVQSLVRLMGGEIKIVDKDERGTCFEFNVFLKIRRHGSSEGNKSPSLGNLSSWSNTPISSPKRQDNNYSTVVLFISCEERRRITQKFLQSHKIEVLAMENIVQLSETLQKFTQEDHNISSSGSDYDLSFGYMTRPGSRHSITSPKNAPLSTKDGNDVSSTQRTKRVTKSRFILLVIDTTQDNCHELHKTVTRFRKNSKNGYFRVVWLGSKCMKLHSLDEKHLPLSDAIIAMPLHGSRLYKLIDFIPGFGSMIPSTPPHERTPQRQDAITSLGGVIPSTPLCERTPQRQVEITTLTGKKVLVADDDYVQQRITKIILLKHGFTIEMCGNGNEALAKVSKGLSDQTNLGTSHNLPYDFILMDCQMPVMDGCEATRQIRLKENDYGVHIPIIGLTAHAEGEEVNNMFEAGIDIYVSKPLNENKLLKVIQDLKLK